jgi:hypothetical protein
MSVRSNALVRVLYREERWDTVNSYVSPLTGLHALGKYLPMAIET